MICDLQRAGYPFDMAWFEPFFEFRFPHYGDLIIDNGIDMELRGAIEPWNVLGEEVTAQGRFTPARRAVRRFHFSHGDTEARRSNLKSGSCTTKDTKSTKDFNEL